MMLPGWGEVFGGIICVSLVLFSQLWPNSLKHTNEISCISVMNDLGELWESKISSGKEISVLSGSSLSVSRRASLNVLERGLMDFTVWRKRKGKIIKSNFCLVKILFF